VAQQGTPPRRPMHGRPDPRDWNDQDPGAGWQSQRAPVQDDRARPDDRGPRQRGPVRPARGYRDEWRDQDPFSSDEGELPPWAGPSIHATRAGGTRLRPPPDVTEESAPPGGTQPRRRGRGRAAAARLRKSRRRVYVYCGTAIVIAVAGAAVAAIHLLSKPVHHSSFITTLQHGEYRTVPKACTAVSPALLGQYLPGHTSTVTPAGTGGVSSQCSITLDHKPTFRVLGVTIEAYAPSAIVAGNGSASANALDTFTVAKQGLAHPPRKSALPPAQISPLTGVGSEGFTAFQAIRRGGTRTDRITVMARQRNLVVTVSLEALASGKGYGPVSVDTLRSGAIAFARDLMKKAAAQPTVKS
jgi:hypothetical protein